MINEPKEPGFKLSPYEVVLLFSRHAKSLGTLMLTDEVLGVFCLFVSFCFVFLLFWPPLRAYGVPGPEMRSETQLQQYQNINQMCHSGNS